MGGAVNAPCVGLLRPRRAGGRGSRPELAGGGVYFPASSSLNILLIDLSAWFVLGSPI